MFRILSFTILKHPLLGGKTFELTNPTETNTPNYYSLIIGPNGTGKSFLLSNLIEVFNDLALIKSNIGYKPKNSFALEYKLGQDVFSISNYQRELVCKKNLKSIKFDDVLLPAKWLASSVTINDKYPILNSVRREQILQYEYLGIRSASNNAFIGRIVTNTVLFLIEALKKQKSESLLKIYTALSLSPIVEITFVGGTMLKLDKKEGLYGVSGNVSKLIQPHREFLKKNKGKANYRASGYKKHIDGNGKMERVMEFMSREQQVFRKPSKASMSLSYEIDLTKPQGIKELLADWDILLIMIDLELFKIKKLTVTKSKPFNYEEASSGEAHLLTSLHGIVAKLEDNSLLVIDEPEISLHPNWQIDYFDILKSVVDNYTGVNVVISSHSHLLVSSLKNEESRITALKRDKKNGEIIIDELDYETYGWEPERILYKIFGLATQRNNYFEDDVRSLLMLLSAPDSNMDDITRLRNNLAKYILSDQEDPLKVIISKADDYISKRNA